MIDAVIRLVMVVFVSQILTCICVGYPLVFFDGPKDGIPQATRSKRSTTPICQPKARINQSSGVITSPQYKTLGESGISCSWLLKFSRWQQLKLEFSEFDVEDSCPGVCKCNHVTIKEPARKARSVSRKYCNERRPPRTLISTGKRLKIHLRLKAGSRFQNNRFIIRYVAVSNEGTVTTLPTEKVGANITGNKKLPDSVGRFIKTPVKGKAFDSQVQANEYKNSLREGRMMPTTKGSARVKKSDSSVDDKESGPSKLTVLLAVAIPVVMIFIFVVLVIAYYNHMIDKKQMQAREDMPNNGSTISEMIMHSSAALAPMFNLKKAKRESSHRREKADRLYDDMLNSWKETNASKQERLKAKQESVNVWESYQASRKQRRSGKDSQNSKAFAMLVSNAINVGTNPSVPEINEPVEEDVEAKPRPSSILINRLLSEDIRKKRSSKVLSWSDISTKGKEEKGSEKRASSETELKIRRSGHIPAIVVSQPSFETEDEGEVNDTDRLITDDKVDAAEPAAEPAAESAKVQPKSTNPPNQTSSPTYSCSKHVKDILRGSYGEELEEWWQKPKKSDSKGSLKDSSGSNVKYKAMKQEEDDID